MESKDPKENTQCPKHPCICSDTSHVTCLFLTSLFLWDYIIDFDWLEMQDYKKNAYMEAELQCSNAIQSMERKLRAACHATDANIDKVVKVSIYWSVFLFFTYMKVFNVT